MGASPKKQGGLADGQQQQRPMGAKQQFRQAAAPFVQKAGQALHKQSNRWAEQRQNAAPPDYQNQLGQRMGQVGHQMLAPQNGAGVPMQQARLQHQQQMQQRYQQEMQQYQRQLKQRETTPVPGVHEAPLTPPQAPQRMGWAQAPSGGRKGPIPQQRQQYEAWRQSSRRPMQ